ncbi:MULTISPECIES: hypothetical protein [Microcystis]|nr:MULTISPECIES: hypothetical protein [Microcystis]
MIRPPAKINNLYSGGRIQLSVISYQLSVGKLSVGKLSVNSIKR